MQIKIGVPSKGRLRKDVLKVFKNNKYNLISERGERDYFAKVKNKANLEIIYLHAREIIERLGDNSLDIGFSGYDLLLEASVNIQKKISIFKKYNFGNAKLVVAIPNQWIDVQTIADLEEISFEFKDNKKQHIRVATKYPNLTRDFLFSKGVTQFKLIESLGATETYPFTGSSEIITDITSTGETLKANNLRILKDGTILSSSAFSAILIMYLLVTSKGVPAGKVSVALTVSLGMRGKKINLVQPLIISVRITKKTPTKPAKVVILLLSAIFNSGW